MQDIEQPDDLGPKPVRRPVSFFHLIYVWRWEMFTWALGTIGLLANVILMVVCDGKLQRDWHSPIQITAFVAALAQVSQSALLVPTASSIAQLKWKWTSVFRRPALDIQQFDLASRGPDGSMRLLWHFALRQNLASLGALSTILLLAFPTFTQQAVQIDTIDSKFLGTEFASLPRALKYQSFDPDGGSANAFYDQADLGTWFSSSYMDVYVKNAIEAGLLAADVSHADITGHCGKERCFWEPYSTLAVCSKVESADHMLSFEGDLPHVPVGEDHVLQKDNKFQAAGTFFAQSRYFAADRQATTTDANLTRIIRSRKTPDNPDTNLPDIAHVYLNYFDPCLGTNTLSGRKEPGSWKAHKATFNLCVQTHQSVYNTSGMHTTVLSTGPEAKWANVSDPDSPSKTQRYCTRMPNSEDEFCISDHILATIGGQLAITLDIKAYWGGPGDHYYVYSNWAPNLAFDVLGADPGICSNDTDHGIKGYEHRIKNIATSLTNTFRNANSSITMAGTASTSEPTIEVNFYWLIFPCVLYVMISGFFVATVFQTRNLPSWKSSALALLWCKETGDNCLSTPDQIKTRSKQARVELVDEGVTWRLKET